MILLLSVAGVLLAAIPLLMLLRNLPLYCVKLPKPDDGGGSLPAVSVLIPARDEEASIGASVGAALASENVAVEVVVLDDHSTDRTGEIVKQLAEQDPRVRHVAGKPLPDGWNGKQFACMQLAAMAKFDRIVFLDADVRLQTDALVRLIMRQEQTNVALLSAFPHQQTGTWLEKWLIPMMHYLLLGFLPMVMMRRTTDARFAAGCGQLFLTRQKDYQRAGTHQAIRGSRHDGIKLPRVFREAGLITDVIDGTELAECRMYIGAMAVIRGVLKNAVEGIANPRIIVVFTVLLLGASVLPVATLIASLLTGQSIPLVLSIVAVVLCHFPRVIAAARFRQSFFGAACHTLATPLFVALQWVALLNHLAGRTVSWRGRTQ